MSAATAPALAEVSPPKWTDVSVTDLFQFELKVIGASLILGLIAAIPVGIIAVIISSQK